MATLNEVISKMEHFTDSKTITDDIILYLNLILIPIKYILEYASRHYVFIVLSPLFTLIFYILYKSYWSPILYVKELSEIGYNHLPHGADRALHLMRAQNSRRVGAKLPPPYPNGWFALVESQELKIGGVVPVDALGLNLCVYRGEDGAARVVNAYCPHLGANLAVGGTVCGNCLECPFHQWRFGADGACVAIPGVESVPKGISIKTYPSMEVDGSVWVWHHVDGLPPQWTVEEPEESKNWGYRGRNEFYVNAHIQEIPENGADVAHLNAVHSVSLLSDLGYKYPFLNHFIGHHIWDAEWTKHGEDHTAEIKITHKYIIMKVDIFPLEVTVNQIGPGHVRLRFDSPLGPLMLVQSVTPLGPLLQKVVHRVYGPRYNAILGSIMVLSEAYQVSLRLITSTGNMTAGSQRIGIGIQRGNAASILTNIPTFQRDVAIWNNKKYVSAPAYVKSDKSIRNFRTWFSQFYSENSISLKDAIQNPLDW